MHLGKAGSITFSGSSGDIILDEWPEIRRDEHSSIANRQDAQIILKRDGSVSSRGVDTKIFREKRKRINKLMAIIMFYLSALNKKRTDSEHGEYRPLSASEVSKDSNCKTIQDLLEEEHQIAGNSNKNKFNTRGLWKTKETLIYYFHRRLVKIYEERRVVDGIDVEVKEKEIVGLLGPNGAGKTTFSI